MSIPLTPDARARLDVHLDAVESALAGAGNTREHRRAVVDDLESQILDMLAARTATPALTDVEAVLLMLDPAAAYGNPGQPTVNPVATPPVANVLSGAPRYSQKAIWGFVCAMLSLLPAAALFLIGQFWVKPMTNRIGSDFGMQREPAPFVVRLQDGHEVQIPMTTMEAVPAKHQSNSVVWGRLLPIVSCLLVVIGPLGIIGMVLGWMAYADIRRSNGTIVGRGLALFDGLFWPVIVLIVFTLAVA